MKLTRFGGYALQVTGVGMIVMSKGEVAIIGLVVLLFGSLLWMLSRP